MKKEKTNWSWAWPHLCLKVATKGVRVACILAAVQAIRQSSSTRSVSYSLVCSSVARDRTRKHPSSTLCCRVATIQPRQPDRTLMSSTAWMKQLKTPCSSCASSLTCLLSTMLCRFGLVRLSLKCCKWLSPCAQQFSFKSFKRSYSMCGPPQRNSIYRVTNLWAKCQNTHWVTSYRRQLSAKWSL